MWRKLAELFRTWDNTLLALTLSLLLIGLAALYASSLARPENFGLFKHQLLGVGIGLTFLLITSAIDYRAYRSWSRVIYLVGIVLLIAVLLWGQNIRSTTGWFRWGSWSFQPVELVKFLWVVGLASWLAQVGPPLNFNKTMAATVLLLPLLVLVLWQPDFGSGFLFIVVWAGLLAVIPKSRRWWLVMLVIVLSAVAIGSLFLKDYQRDRLRVFLDPQAEPLGSGYNVTQSIIAVGSAGGGVGVWG